MTTQTSPTIDGVLDYYRNTFLAGMSNDALHAEYQRHAVNLDNPDLAEHQDFIRTILIEIGLEMADRDVEA